MFSRNNQTLYFYIKRSLRYNIQIVCSLCEKDIFYLFEKINAIFTIFGGKSISRAIKLSLKKIWTQSHCNKDAVAEILVEVEYWRLFAEILVGVWPLNTFKSFFRRILKILLLKYLLGVDYWRLLQKRGAGHWRNPPSLFHVHHSHLERHQISLCLLLGWEERRGAWWAMGRDSQGRRSLQI